MVTTQRIPTPQSNRIFEDIKMHEYSMLSDRWEPPLEDNVQNNLSKEFKGNLSTGIWNATAFFCCDPVKAVQRLYLACELAGKVDVLGIVEAHWRNGSEVMLRARLRNLAYQCSYIMKICTYKNYTFIFPNMM